MTPAQDSSTAAGARASLASIGLVETGAQHWNEPTVVLVEQAITRGEGKLTYPVVVKLESAASLSAIAAQLVQPGKGLVSFVVPGGPGEEVEIALAKKHAVTATLRSTVAAIPGVLSVEAV